MIQHLTSLHSLSVDYNGFSPMALLALINSLTLLNPSHQPFQKLSLCGNNMNTESSRALGGLLTHANGMSLTSLYLDHMNIEVPGEQQIAASIASNQHCQLVTLTGIQLGPLMIELGSPPELETFSNSQVLKYVREMWASYEQKNGPTNGEGDTNTGQDQVAIDDYPETDDDEQEQRGHSEPFDDRQSIGRKRAASLEQTSYPTRTDSEDDLTDLADDVEVHLRSSQGPLVNTSRPNKRESGLAETTVEPSSITTEQIRSLIKKLEQIFDVSFVLCLS
jgi:hypothetical protein